MKRVRSSRLILVNSFRTLAQVTRSPFRHTQFLSHVSFIFFFSTQAILRPKRKKFKYSCVILNQSNTIWYSYFKFPLKDVHVKITFCYTKTLYRVTKQEIKTAAPGQVKRCMTGQQQALFDELYGDLSPWYQQDRKICITLLVPTSITHWHNKCGHVSDFTHEQIADSRWWSNFLCLSDSPRWNCRGKISMDTSNRTKVLTQDRNHLDSKFKNIAGCFYVYEIQRHHEFFPYDAAGTLQFVNPYFWPFRARIICLSFIKREWRQRIRF